MPRLRSEFISSVRIDSRETEIYFESIHEVVIHPTSLTPLHIVFPMANGRSVVTLLSRAAIIGVVFIAVLYQFIFKQIIFGTLGYGRKVQSIKDFPNVNCEKIDELGLEGCEDMWLHEKTGYLYMACSDSQSRTQWFPAFVSSQAIQMSLRSHIQYPPFQCVRTRFDRPHRSP